MAKKPPILVVLDDAPSRDYLLQALRVNGYPAEGVEGAELALEKLGSVRTGVLVADLFLKGVNGVELLRRAREVSPSTQVVLMGKDAPTYTVVTAMKQGAIDFVMRPVDIDYFLTVVEKAVGHYQLTQENEALRRLHARKPGNMVAESPAMKEILSTLSLVAPTDLTVLIEGQSGVGKELVANRLHELSQRAMGAFVAVNCGAIQESLLESELFGHVKGAFTGAHQDHQGLFSAADGGTLFLDEVGEMDLELQVKLLRVLERSEFRPVGGSKLVRVNVRVVAATNKRLQEEVAAGRFREDLYYRLNVIHIEVPPLKDRPDDVPALIEAFLATHLRKGLPQRSMSSVALDALKAYAWPGNVRELRNVIERCMILSRGPLIGVEDLPAMVRGAQAVAPVASASELPDLNTPLSEVERRHILRVLESQDGNKVRTSKVLGINVKTLYNKLKSYEERGMIEPRS